MSDDRVNMHAHGITATGESCCYGPFKIGGLAEAERVASFILDRYPECIIVSIKSDDDSNLFPVITYGRSTESMFLRNEKWAVGETIKLTELGLITLCCVSDSHSPRR